MVTMEEQERGSAHTPQLALDASSPPQQKVVFVVHVTLATESHVVMSSTVRGRAIQLPG